MLKKLKRGGFSFLLLRAVEGEKKQMYRKCNTRKDGKKGTEKWV
jgi:hypothetical protein